MPRMSKFRRSSVYLLLRTYTATIFTSIYLQLLSRGFAVEPRLYRKTIVLRHVSPTIHVYFFMENPRTTADRIQAQK